MKFDRRRREWRINERGNIIHLPGLDALRLYAATSVVVAHIRHNFGELRARPAHIGIVNALFLDAQSAVNFFFVLSGFLITYLLLMEHTHTGTIFVKRFYFRRALRIWPLYYLTVFLGFVALPALLGTTSMFQLTPSRPVGTWLVLLIMANFVTGLGPLGHLWSIGLEEQFYLAWPWAVREKHKILRIVFGVIIVKLLVYPAVMFMNVDSITNLFVGLRFECMAIGALAAYLYHNKHEVLRIVYSKITKLALLFGFIFLALVDIPLSEPTILASSVFFALLILNISTNSRLGHLLELPILHVLGRTSYGIYMFHYPLLYGIIIALNRAGFSEGPAYQATLYAATISGTILLAQASYQWLESPFLRLKERYAVTRIKA